MTDETPQPLPPQDNEKPWYESRKLRYALGAIVLCFVAAFGGKAMGLSESLITMLVGTVAGIAVALLGTHAYTDVRVTPTDMISTDNMNTKLGMFDMLMQQLAPLLPGVFRIMDRPREAAKPEPETPTEDKPS